MDNVNMEVKYIDSEDFHETEIEPQQKADQSNANSSEDSQHTFPNRNKIDKTWAKYDSCLITAIMKRPVLWNHVIKAKEHTIKKAWDEVATELGGKFDVTAIKKRWRNLRDSYVKFQRKVESKKSNINVATYNAQTDDGFRFYKEMQFLNKYFHSKTPRKILPKIVVSAPKISNVVQSSPQNHKVVSLSNQQPMCNVNIDSNLLKIKKPDKVVDGVDGFLIQLAEILRKLPYKNRRLLQNKIMEDALNAEEEAGLL